jgi:hypothetical protein
MRNLTFFLHVAYLWIAISPWIKAAETEVSTHWLQDYGTARESAISSKKLLLVWFCSPANEAANTKFQQEVLDQAAVADRIGASFVAVKVPLDARSKDDDRERRLIDHEAFAELRGQPGLAIVDLSDKDSPTYGLVISIYPFSRRTIKTEHLAVLLDLPPGTLTQRTLIFAVRTHPGQPASATGNMHPLLAAESANHSRHQASINLQGHHGWDARFHSINARLPAGHVSYEVCSESWPGQSLLDAAEECVDSWRQSSGHWGQVSRQAEYYGYDMQRGTNGVWYATGIFGRRR